MRGAGKGHGSDLHGICPPSRHQMGKCCPEAVTTTRRAQRWGRACVTELPGLPLLPDKRVFLQGPRPAQGGFLEQLVECVSRAHSLPQTAFQHPPPNYF